MNYPTKTDPVIVDEASYDRQCEANRIRMDRCRAAAQEEYENGDLDAQVIEWLADDNATDCANLASSVIAGLDKWDMDLYLSREATAIASIRSTIDAVIEDRAEEMYDSGENY